MAQAKYLIDTNAIIDYLGGKLPDSGMARNVSDFKTIKKLETLNPHTIS